MPDTEHLCTDFDPPLDIGINAAVLALREHGVDTFESCEGGAGHAYPEPTVRFHGDTPEGFRALAAAMKEGLPVAELRRVWPILDEEPTGPWWEITFARVPSILANTQQQLIKTEAMIAREERALAECPEARDAIVPSIASLVKIKRQLEEQFCWQGAGLSVCDHSGYA